MLRCVIFDLDDTLYNERHYVESAMLRVAEYFGQKYEMNIEEVYQELMQILDEKGRGKIFNIFMDNHAIEENVADIVQIYRDTKPRLSLYQDAEETITELKKKGILLGIITDGCSKVQHRKIDGLQIRGLFDEVIVTDDYEQAAKPSTLPYCMILDRHPQLKPEECIYIGDNPNKDFMGAREVGMATARIIRAVGDHMKTRVSEEKEADFRLKSLTELLGMI